jgi:hypothetical protein
MFEDGIYVSYFLDDVSKSKDPRSVVVIENSKATIMINPKADSETKTYLSGIVNQLAKASSKDDYENIAYIGLGKFWESNGYAPNPSDFFDTGSDKANKALQIARNWAAAK